MYLLGVDIGSSSVKASIIQGESGLAIGTVFYPKQEMEIIAFKSGWAEQNPENWWLNLTLAVKELVKTFSIDVHQIKAIGISYQMHGLVCIDKDKNVLRPSIIWCDSRAVSIGNDAYEMLGKDYCLNHCLNSPGNFTASKLKWVKDNEPELFSKIWKIMLPGDYIAMKMTDDVNTTISGLSEGILWDFKEHSLAKNLMDHYGLESSLIPNIVATFGEQGVLTSNAALEMGLTPGIKVTYRAGDQPNNALSLNVLNPGEVAATAGTSGVVYGVSEQIKFDNFSRVNSFAHVNHNQGHNRLGVLLCVNGTGILNSWMKKNVASQLDYTAMNDLATTAPIGSDGLTVLPFGNGAERIFKNVELGAQVSNLNFNIHSQAHILRASQEGIAFSLQYGLEIMHEMGIETKTIRAGKANMMLSPLFRNTLASVSGANIELYETDGAQGAARGAGIGSGYYDNFVQAFSGLQKLDTIEPDQKNVDQYQEAYQIWKTTLNKSLN